MDKVKDLVDIFKKNNVHKILDLGCGSGKHILYLAERGFDTYGIDLSERAIEVARKLFDEKKLNVDLKIGNIFERLPYDSDSFDAIISFRVINHGKREDIENLIREMNRVLKSDGLVFVTVSKPSKKPKELPKIKRLDQRTSMNLEGEEAGVIHFLFNKEILKKIFEDVGGFEIINLYVDKKGYFCLFAKKSTS